MGHGMPGGRVISASAGAEAAELLEEMCPRLTPEEADMVIQYVCYRYQHEEVEGARKTLRNYVDLTGALRIEAVLHTAI